MGFLPDLNVPPEEYFAATKVAAEGGNVGAMIELAKCYENGIGTEVNLELAERWRKKTGIE